MSSLGGRRTIKKVDWMIATMVIKKMIVSFSFERRNYKISLIGHFPVEDVDCFESRLDKRFLSHQTKLTITLDSCQPTIIKNSAFDFCNKAAFDPGSTQMKELKSN